ncbi:MAG: sensor histidine kinase [Eggerthellaceae bacterium]|jgi:signal transduction histidine kinase|nr:sensor histidine kinase [Eggerthellaceae bacterium]
MKFSAYCLDHAQAIALNVAGLLFVSLLLHALSVDGRAIIVICAVILICFVLAGILDWHRRARYYTLFAGRVASLDKPYLITDVIGHPPFHEGQIAYSIIQTTTRAMNETISDVQSQQQGYRDYVETWVHEIKTPIAASWLILENNPNAASSALSNELEHIEQYVEQALYVARSTDVEADYLIRLVSVRDLINAAIKQCSRTLIEAHIALRIDPIDDTVMTDRKWLVFILSQIISNAARYQNTEELNPCIHIYVQHIPIGQDGIESILHIKDNGIGIPAADLSRVFARGFTGDNGRRYPNSTGMGLYLCKTLCTHLGISLSIDSEQGHGTTLSIGFPQNPLHFAGESYKGESNT